VLASVALQLLIIVVPPLRGLFGTFPLSAREWLLAAGAGLAPVLLMGVSPLRRLAPDGNRET